MNKKIKNACQNEYEGIKFKSRLETMTYRTLRELGINVSYEPHTYIIWYGKYPVIPYYTKDKNTRNLYLNNKKMIDIKYTPDFMFEYEGIKVYIECKGMENDVFYIKRKMFRAYLDERYAETGEFSMYFEIYSKRNLLEALDIIKKYATTRKN